VVGSFYEDKPFMADVDMAFQGFHRWGTLTREYQDGASLLDATNLDFQESVITMVPRLDIGIYRDLELFATFPVVLLWSREWNFNPSTNAYSRFTMNRHNMPGQPASDAIVKPQGGARHWGYGDMTVGVRWAIYNDQRPTHTLDRDKESGRIWWDDTIATWLVEFAYTAPTGNAIDAAEYSSGPGKKAHLLSFGTAVSKRFRLADPYIGLFYQFPLPTCTGDKNSPDYRTCIRPGQRGSMTLGTEIIPFENHKAGNKVAIDIRLGATYVSDADLEYSEAADLLPGWSFFVKKPDGSYVLDADGYPKVDPANRTFGRLTATEQYLELVGWLGLNANIVKYVRLSTYIGFGHDTLHYLTYDKIGSGDGGGYISSTESNPLYETELDERGKRTRLADTFLLFWTVSLAGQF
jgi:hypothetical protein